MLEVTLLSDVSFALGSAMLLLAGARAFRAWTDRRAARADWFERRMNYLDEEGR